MGWLSLFWWDEMVEFNLMRWDGMNGFNLVR